MALTAAEKAEVIKEYQQGNKDTGSTGVQVALLTTRINELTEHLKENVKDKHSRHGLLKMVSKRRRLLDYQKREDYQQYLALIERLGIRR
jgi:small subunit ribosomal protein S15